MIFHPDRKKNVMLLFLKKSEKNVINYFFIQQKFTVMIFRNFQKIITQSIFVVGKKIT